MQKQQLLKGALPPLLLGREEKPIKEQRKSPEKRKLLESSVDHKADKKNLN